MLLYKNRLLTRKNFKDLMITLIKRLSLPLFIGVLLSGCALTEEDRKQYKWEIDKAISMQKFLLDEGVNNITNNNNTSAIDNSIAYINYIACMERNKRRRVRFSRAKIICIHQNEIK